MSISAETRRLPEQQPDRFHLPTIVDVYSIDRRELGISAEVAPASISRYEVSDPFLEAIPEDDFALLRAQERSANGNAEIRRLRKQWDRRPGTAYIDSSGDSQEKRFFEWGDPVASDDFFGDGPNGLGDPGLRAWRSLVPTAAALAYLSDPFRVESVTDSRNKTVEASDATRLWLAGCTDAAAIRSRASGMASAVKGYIEQHDIMAPTEPITMMSIACGTALPTLQAAMFAGAKNPSLLLIDKDKRSMGLTQQLAKEIGFNGQLVSEAVDIFDPNALATLKTELTKDGVDRRPHIVDAMGIFEYTSASLRTPDKADDPSLLYDPVKFLKAGFDLVRPGGRYIFGQMRKDRPVADFTMGVVRWPYVCMRSPQEVMEIIVEAGIKPEWVSMTVTPEGVYTLASIDKPLELSPESADTAAVKPEGRENLVRGWKAAIARIRMIRSSLAVLATHRIL